MKKAMTSEEKLRKERDELLEAVINFKRMIDDCIEDGDIPKLVKHHGTYSRLDTVLYYIDTDSIEDII